MFVIAGIVKNGWEKLGETSSNGAIEIKVRDDIDQDQDVADPKDGVENSFSCHFFNV